MKVDIAAKKAIEWKKIRRRAGKWKEWDSGHTAERGESARAKDFNRLEIRRKTGNCRESLWIVETMLSYTPFKIHKCLEKATSALIMQRPRGKKVCMRSFLYSVEQLQQTRIPKCSPCR